jgi:cytochrome c
LPLVRFVPGIALVVLLPAAALATDALVGRYACSACHQADRKAVGPSWKDIATRYADGSKTAEQLAATIRGGSTGTWGQIPMPAQAHVPAADAATLAAWILQKK